MSQAIRITSISTNLGANTSLVGFKTLDTSQPLARVTGEYEIEVDGRYDQLDDQELIVVLEKLVRKEDDNG